MSHQPVSDSIRNKSFSLFRRLRWASFMPVMQGKPLEKHHDEKVAEARAPSRPPPGRKGRPSPSGYSRRLSHSPARPRLSALPPQKTLQQCRQGHRCRPKSGFRVTDWAACSAPQPEQNPPRRRFQHQEQVGEAFVNADKVFNRIRKDRRQADGEGRHRGRKNSRPGPVDDRQPR